MANKKKNKEGSPPLTLGQRIAAIKALEDGVMDDVPWFVRRIFTDKFMVNGREISLTNDGDFVSREEAIEALKWMVEQLESV
jgi:hypothetical protein